MEKYTKTQLRKMRKAMLLDILREAYPWKGEWWCEVQTKPEIITHILDEQANR